MPRPVRPAGEDRRRSIGARRNPASQEAILDAASAILAEAGLSGFSIEAVARRARAGKPTIYRWWPNRAALLLDVYHRQKSAVSPASSGDTEADLRAFLQHLLDHWRRTGAGEVFRSVVAEAQQQEGASAALRGYVEERRGQTAEIFRRGIARGELSAGIDVELATETAVGLAWLWLLSGQIEQDETKVAAAARQIVAGLRPTG